MRGYPIVVKVKNADKRGGWRSRHRAPFARAGSQKEMVTPIDTVDHEYWENEADVCSRGINQRGLCERKYVGSAGRPRRPQAMGSNATLRTSEIWLFEYKFV